MQTADPLTTAPAAVLSEGHAFIAKLFGDDPQMHAEIDKIDEFNRGRRIPADVSPNANRETEIRFWLVPAAAKSAVHHHFDTSMLFDKLIEIYGRTAAARPNPDTSSRVILTINNNFGAGPAAPTEVIRVAREYEFADGRFTKVACNVTAKRSIKPITQLNPVDRVKSRIVCSFERPDTVENVLPPGVTWNTEAADHKLFAMIRFEFRILPLWLAMFSLRFDITNASETTIKNLMFAVLAHPLFSKATTFGEKIVAIRAIRAKTTSIPQFPYDIAANDCEIEFEFTGGPRESYIWINELTQAYRVFFNSPDRSTGTPALTNAGFRYLVPLAKFGQSDTQKAGALIKKFDSDTLQFNDLLCRVKTLTRKEWFILAARLGETKYYVSDKYDGNRAIVVFDIAESESSASAHDVEIFCLRSELTLHSKITYDSKYKLLLQKMRGVTIFDCELCDQCLYAFDILAFRATGYSEDLAILNTEPRTAQSEYVAGSLINKTYTERYGIMSKHLSEFEFLLRDDGSSDPEEPATTSPLPNINMICTKNQVLLDRARLPEQLSGAFAPKMPIGNIDRDGIVLTAADSVYYNTATYKIKPPSHNTVDFLVINAKASNAQAPSQLYERGNGFSPEDYMNGRLFWLCVSAYYNNIATLPHEYMSRFMQEIVRNYSNTAERHGVHVPIPFVTAIQPASHAFLYTSEAAAIISSDDLHGKVCEMRYEDGKWHLLRVRADKTAEYLAKKGEYGNSYMTALGTLSTILDPITEHDLMEPGGATVRNMRYFDDEDVPPVVRDTFAGYLKYNLLVRARTYETTTEKTIPANIISFCAGRGSELMASLYYGARHIVATDADIPALINLESRLGTDLVSIRRSNSTGKRSAASKFWPISARVGAKDKLDGHIFSFDEPDREREIGSCSLEIIVHKFDGAAARGADPIVDQIRKTRAAGETGGRFQFATIHLAVNYLFESAETMAEFVRAAARLIAPGGRLVVTFPNGEKISSRFDATGTLSRPFSQREIERITPEVMSRLPYPGLKYMIKAQPSAGPGPYGQKVLVLNRQFANFPLAEYLVHPAALIRALEPKFKFDPENSFDFDAPEIRGKFQRRFAGMVDAPSEIDLEMSGLYTCYSFIRTKH